MKCLYLIFFFNSDRERERDGQDERKRASCEWLVVVVQISQLSLAQGLLTRVIIF